MTYKESIREFCDEFGYKYRTVFRIFRDYKEFVYEQLAEQEPIRINGLVEFNVTTLEDQKFYDFHNQKVLPIDKVYLPTVNLTRRFRKRVYYALNPRIPATGQDSSQE